MTEADQKRLNWAHSVYSDPGSTKIEKRKAAAVIAKLDPEGFEDYDDDPIRTRGMWDN